MWPLASRDASPVTESVAPGVQTAADESENVSAPSPARMDELAVTDSAPSLFVKAPTAISPPASSSAFVLPSAPSLSRTIAPSRMRNEPIVPDALVMCRSAGPFFSQLRPTQPPTS